MSRGIFITGTDTGVGKTYVAAGILRWLRHKGLDVIPMKPVQTGAENRQGRMIAQDLEACLTASGLELSADELKLAAPYIYEPACSPHLAGRMAGRYPELPEIARCAERLLQIHKAIVVEGAGGVMVPLNESHSMLDLVKKLGYPVVLVSRVGLGSINHALLSIRVLRTSGIGLVGVVFNRTAPSLAEDLFIEEDNPKTVSRFGGVTVLGNIPYLGADHVTEDTWNRFEESMPGLVNIFQAFGA